jgi:NADPH:quinone reductase-like Zn-dependent oxidoreductase
VIVGGETGGKWLDGLDRQLRAVLLSPFVGQRLGFFVNKENAADLTALRELIEAGQVSPALDRVYPLAEVPAAIRRLLDGGVIGKVAITIG